ncbi:MAG: response regulator [Methanomicrobiaceae archaeon]|nr:response regulator [Methanomicrobiaceae archaeon]
MALILVTDDSFFQRKIITSVLAEEGHDLMEATNGREALLIAERKNPDLILLDLLMPDMDGFQFLEAAREKKISAPVIVLTSDIQDTTKGMCLKLGAAGFVNKPVEKEKLLPVINRVLSE